MSRNQLLITAITTQGLSYREAARIYGVSKSLIHKLHQQQRADPDSTVEPRSRRPRTSPNSTSETTRARILELRQSLTKDGLDAGADTIVEHLHREQISISRTTVWRILKTEGQVTSQPQKRPRSSWQRFAADQPNEMWQSDFTHVTLSTGQDTEVIGWLDDHSRYLLHLTAHHRVTGKIVTDSFTTAAQTHGYPASTLTDNGMVYTTRYARGGANRGKNAFETLLALNGITQKNGKPFKPTTQGKIERFWQTLKRHLDTKPAASIADLQHTLDQFRDYYNTIRPHRGINRRTPTIAYTLIPKATPTLPDDPDLWRVRYDIIDPGGTITIRHAGRIRHLGIGRGHARTEVICLIHNDHATVITHTGEVLGEYTIDPERDYQPKDT